MNRIMTGRPRAAPSQPETERDRAWRRVQLAARALSAAWFAFCSYGVISDVLTTTPNASPVERGSMIAGGILLLALPAALPWRWERAGGILLILVGTLATLSTGLIIVQVGPGAGLLAAGAVIGLMPIVAGTLFLAHAAAVQKE